VDVFDSHFQQVQLAGSFTDPDIPDGFAPFGIRNVNGTLFVTYAKQNDAKHDDVAGAGNGFIDEFDTDGNFIQRFASQGALNSPHGMAVAPADFGAFSNALLVGNFGDGRINAFDLNTGRFLGQLSDAGGRPLANSGIWGMTFGNGAGGTRTNTLYFAAGINHEQDGLFGAISLAANGKRKGRGSIGFTGAPLVRAARDAVLDLLGRVEVHQPSADRGERLKPQDQSPPVAFEVFGSASNQVSPAVSEHHVPTSAQKEPPLDLAETLDVGLDR
jgi:hypothetical protein